MCLILKWTLALHKSTQILEQELFIVTTLILLTVHISLTSFKIWTLHSRVTNFWRISQSCYYGKLVLHFSKYIRRTVTLLIAKKYKLKDLRKWYFSWKQTMACKNHLKRLSNMNSQLNILFHSHLIVWVMVLDTSYLCEREREIGS